nr:unnamed protein product [Callosobruchus analis]
MTVFLILKEQLSCPYHLEQVQHVQLPRDFPSQFCNWLLEMFRRDHDFLKTIEFTLSSHR